MIPLKSDRIRNRVTLLLVFGLSVLAPGQAYAQSLSGVQGLGSPPGAADARSAALGNLGIGLKGLELSPLDPTASAELLLPTVTFSMQPTWGEFTLGGETNVARGTRFPLIGVGYPVDRARGVVTVSIAGFLEQRWRVRLPGTIDLGGTTVDADDRFQSDGGASVARLGWAQRLGDRLAVGVSVGAYIGSLDQTFVRALDTLDVQGGQRFVDEDTWLYQGKTAGLGVRFDPSDAVRVSAALEWSTDLSLEPEENTEGGRPDVAIPVRYSVGATADLTSRLSFNASTVFQDWSGTEGLSDGIGNGNAVSYGAGLEWAALVGSGRSFPIRLGYRHVALPFRFDTEDAVETSFSAGLGLNIAETQGQRFGWIDLAIERGEREAGSLAEKFWRGTVSVGISRF